MTFATLSIDLVAKFAQFDKDLGAVARAAEKQAAKISAAFDGVKSTLVGLGASLTVGAAFAWLKNVADGVDRLNDLKDATGASVKNLSALEDIAARTGTSFDAVGTGLVKFNAALSNAKPDSDAAKAFDALGLSVKTLKALDPAEALRLTAVALSNFADDGNKARLVQELFGKSLREVAPFLADLAKQGQLNATVTSQQADEAERFNHQLSRLAKNSFDASRALAGPLITGLNALIEKFREGSREGDNLLVTLLKQTEIARLLRLNSAGGGFGGTGVNSGLAALTGSTQIGGAYDRSAARLLRQGQLSVGDPFGDPAKVGSKKPAEGIKAVTTELDRYLESLTKGLEKELELTEVQKVQLRIAEASAQGFSEALRAGLLGAAAQLDAIKSINEAQEERIRIGRNLAIESGSAVNDSNGARQAQLTSLLAATDSAKLEATRADMMLLTEEYQRFIDTVGAAGISEKQYFEAVNERLGLNAEELKKSKSLAEELGLSFTSAFEDAIVGGSKFSDLLKGLERDIIAIVTRQYVTKPLTTALDGLFKSDGGGGIGGLFSSIFGSIFGGPKADGGPVSGGTPYLVGERGPEMFVPRGSGTIVPNARMGRSMVIHINPPAGMSRQSSSQFAADVARQLRLADARNG